MQMLIWHNLIKGGELDNAIVIGDKDISHEELKELASYFNRRDITVAPQGILNNTSLRYADEPARHKLMDMIGDISLVGFPLRGAIKGVRAGHEANVAFATKLRSEIIQEGLS